MKKAREKYLLIQIQRYKDTQSFSEVYQLLVEPIYRFIFFKVNSREIAEDLTSEVFLKCWRELIKRTEKEPVQHLKAYFYQTARHLVIDHYRSKERKIEVPVEYYQLEITDQGPQKEVEQKVDTDIILQFVKRLKESYQEVIILRHVEELSTREIARVLEKSPVSTRVLLHRANQALKREYEKAARTTKKTT